MEKIQEQVPVVQLTLARTLELVDSRLRTHVDDLCLRWSSLMPGLTSTLGLPLPDELARFSAGGKRLRPSLCHWGWVAAGASDGLDDMLRAGVALELLHCFGLIHDDVMDGSRWRRGRPAVHVWAEQLHQRTGGAGGSARFGENVAILTGDLALAEVYSVVMGLPDRMRRQWQEFTLELLVGQGLDLAGAAAHELDLDTTLTIARAKSGGYTVTMPLVLGAMAADGSAETLAVLEEFGDRVGLAFALRDDLLGILGEPAQTGKPQGEDIRDRKPTVIRALGEAAGLRWPTGDDTDDVQAGRLVDRLRAAGVITQVEDLIAEQVDAAIALTTHPAIDPDARDGLAAAAELLAWRPA